ncbi:MAG: SusC/RagA family TonB-linked outer membrane protein [Bacteroidales bacterium]|nr:SusC/RagA family TonB-linked outer membrane protein [Bacteroidales bacterium]
MIPLLLALFMATVAWGQRGTVTGVVSDAQTGETLPGANVVIQGTTIGTVTDIDGQYSLDVSAGEVTLVASFLGYNPSVRTINIGAGELLTINFPLELDIATLEEFVIIGYGVQRREDATGSVAVVGERDFNRGNITTPAELLRGKMPGVQITSAGGAPGTGETIRIRGGSSLDADNNPLIVIDGVPIESAGVPGLRNPLSTINPSDIETFTVLKDASATAIYGSRASNGVIIITTKKGQKDMPLQFDYSGSFSLAQNIRTVDVLNADDFRQIVQERYEGRTSVLNMLGTASTNWQDHIFQDAFSHDHLLSARGAYRNVPYRISIGYKAEEGVLQRDHIERTSLAVNLSPTLFDNHLNVNLNVRGVNINNQFANEGAIGSAVSFDPTKPVRVDSPNFGGYYTWLEGDMPITYAINPVALLDLTNNDSNVKRLIGNAQLEYKVHWLPELTANMNVAYDYSESEGNNFTPDYAPWAYVSGGSIGRYGQERKNQLFDFYLNYANEIPGLNSRFDVMAGYSYQYFWNKGYNFSSNIEGNIFGTEYRIFDDLEYESDLVLISFFGRMNYYLMDRYLFTFTLRNDHTSRFSADTRSGVFPSAAFAWRIDKENFMDNLDFFNELKLRLGWGVTGQQNIGHGNYPYLARYTRSREGARYPFGNVFLDTWRPEGYDSEIKWEETTTYNAGIDYGLFGDRYYGSIDFYFRETRDLINVIPVPAGTNLTNFILTNVGNMENTGVEFSIFTRPIVTRDFRWELGLNATWNDTKITRLTAVDDPNYPGTQEGFISGGVGNRIQIHSVGYTPYTFWVYQQVYDENGNPIEGLYVDRNGDGEITSEDLYRFKSPMPTYYLGITSEFLYKNWSFAFAGRANFDNWVYNNVSSVNGELSRLFRPEGPYLSNITSDALDVNFNQARYLSDYYIQNGSFFKMDHITLGYNFFNVMGTGANLNVSAIVQNAFTITKYDGLDPEVHSGIDNNIYPRPRTFVLNVNLQF